MRSVVQGNLRCKTSGVFCTGLERDFPFSNFLEACWFLNRNISCAYEALITLLGNEFVAIVMNNVSTHLVETCRNKTSDIDGM